MSFFQRLGLATGLLIEDKEDAVNMDSSIQLTDEQQAALNAQIDEEMATHRAPQASEGQVNVVAAMQAPTMPPVTKPMSSPSLADYAPEDIRVLVDDEIKRASEPAYTLFLQLDRQLMDGIPDASARAVTVIAIMETTHRFKPNHILYDLLEALEACQGIQTEIENGRDSTISEQVTDLETDADAKLALAGELRTQADELEAQAKSQKSEAVTRRNKIMQTVESALHFIEERSTALLGARQSLEMQNPNITPEEPPGNVRPN